MAKPSPTMPLTLTWSIVRSNDCRLCTAACSNLPRLTTALFRLLYLRIESGHNRYLGLVNEYYKFRLKPPKWGCHYQLLTRSIHNICIYFHIPNMFIVRMNKSHDNMICRQTCCPPQAQASHTHTHTHSSCIHDATVSLSLSFMMHFINSSLAVVYIAVRRGRQRRHQQRQPPILFYYAFGGRQMVCV